MVVDASTVLICPEHYHWKSPFYVQWTHLQDVTGPAHHHRRDMDEEMTSFWNAVGSLFPYTTYSHIVAYRDDTEDGNESFKYLWPHIDEIPLSATFEKQKPADIIDIIDKFPYVTNYDGYDGGWKALVQASTTEEGNIFGWNESLLGADQGSNPKAEDIVRLVTMVTPTQGKTRKELTDVEDIDGCPSRYYWDHCNRTYHWNNKFEPGDILNLPSTNDAAAQMDKDIIYKIVVTNAGTTDFDVNNALEFWRRQACKMRGFGFYRFLDVQSSTANMFEDVMQEIIKKGCIHDGTTEEKAIEAKPAVQKPETAFADVFAEQLGALSLECPAGKTRKENFLVQWMHLQDGTMNSEHRRHDLDGPARDFWNSVTTLYPDSAFASMNVFADDEWSGDYSWVKFWVKNAPFATTKEVTLDSFLGTMDSISYKSNYDKYEGGFKALVLAGTTEAGNKLGWDSEAAKAVTTNEDDMLRIVTLHTHAPPKVAFEDRVNREDYCVNRDYWADCENINNRKSWFNKYEPDTRYNLPTMLDAVAQMDKNAVYSIVVTPWGTSDKYLDDAPKRWQRQVTCRMNAFGYDATMLTSTTNMFDRAREEFVRKACV